MSNLESRVFFLMHFSYCWFSGVFHTVERIIKIILKIIYSFVIQYVDETANKLILSGVNTLKMSMLTDCSLKERRRATSAPTSQVPH